MTRILLRILCCFLVMTPVYAKDYLIKNATLHTLTSTGVIKNADIYVSDGFIMQVGRQLSIRTKHQIIDATNKHVTPGLIAAWSQIGLEEISAAESTVDHRTTLSRYGASFNIAPALNFKSTLIPHNRTQGLTRAIVAPTEGEKLYQGMGVAISLSNIQPELSQEVIAQFARYGDQGAKIAGGSRAAAYMDLDLALQEADYLRNNRSQYKPGHDWHFSLSVGDLDSLKLVLEKKIPLVVHVHRSDDILTLINLAKKHHIRLVIRDAAEAWMVANELALAKVPVIIDPLMNIPSSFESLAIKLEGPAILNEAGVKLSFSNMSSHNAYLVRQSAGNAVTYGLPAEEAIKAMTINTAEIFGIKNYGTIELGMEADLVIWDGDPLEVTSHADAVLIKGVKQSMVSRASRLKDRFWDLSNITNKAYVK